MVVSKFKCIGKHSLLALAIVMTVGGTKAASTLVGQTEVDHPGQQAQQVAQTGAIASSTPFSICSEATDWQRPSADQQQKQLTENERYSALMQDKDFQDLANQFWQHDVLSFTTYGLSARMDPIALSGLWNVAEDVWANCYSQDEGNAINAGNLAEAWIMNHRVVDVQWQSEAYVIVVDPSQQGMQVVQFARHETGTDLPLTVVTTQGTVLEHHVADW